VFRFGNIFQIKRNFLVKIRYQKIKELGFFMPSYYLLIIVTLIIGLIASGDVKRQLNKYSKVPISNGITGAQAAMNMLRYYGIGNVTVKMGSEGQDFFDPRTNSITLSPSAFHGRTVTATATACHEVGHACQYAQNYVPMKIRGSLVPAAQLASNAWFIIFLMGIVLHISGFYTLAIVMYIVVVLFELVTLPVEFDASNRAKKYMSTIGLTQSDQSGSAKVLRSCACTYVAAALTSVLQLLWLLGQSRD
jgi:uncharacterized protein